MRHSRSFVTCPRLRTASSALKLVPPCEDGASRAAEGWRRRVMKGRDRGRLEREKKRMMETKWGQNENVDPVLYGFKRRELFIQSSISGRSQIL